MTYVKFSLTLYVNWITWRTECGTIYKNISNFKKSIEVVKVYAIILNNCNSHIYFIAL